MEKKLNVSISIEGNAIQHFSSFSLEQKFNEHHKFELRFNHDLVETQGSVTLDNSKNFMGKNITVEFGYVQGSEQLFVGKITRVEFSQSHGYQGDLIVSGYSPTILLERGPDLGSYLNKDLRSIIQKATSDTATNDLRMKVKPLRTDPIDYIIQYRESDFEFINRLSAEYHEWFFYDGANLNFGKPDKLKEATLVYGRNLQNLQYALQIAPLKYRKFAYNPKQDEVLTSDGMGNRMGTPDMSHAISASNEVYSKGYNQPLPIRVDNKRDIDAFVQNEQKAIISDLVRVTGSGDEPQVALGGIVHISTSVRQLMDFAVQDFGRFLVTSIFHHIDGLGHYYNTFEAVAADTERLPVPHVQKPSPDMQLATVLDNNDPDKQGRIKVKFKWECGANDPTEWLRVVSPSAGSYKDGNSNRGFIAIPEKDDQVIIAFEEGNIARPVVIGSVYHNANGDSQQQVSNHLKSISTRSGILIQFNDTDNKGSLTISDPSGNTWYMDGNGSITVTAPKHVTINAGENITFNAGSNILSNAGENITANAGKDITTNAGENMTDNAGAMMSQMAIKDFSLQAANIKKVAMGNINVQGKNVIKQAMQDVKITSTGGNINKHAQQEVQNNSGQSTKHN